MNAIKAIYGVDFSGAEKVAGRQIWICRLSLTDDGPLVKGCIPSEQLPGSSARRAPSLAALSRFIGQHGPAAIFGLDFPFSLPQSLLGECDWASFVLSFARTYPDCESFRMSCREKTDGRELKRRTDRETQTPFSAYNLRLYRQTYFGIRDVVGPLVRNGSAWFAPMEKRIPGKPCVVEICPASTLKRHGLYRSYKGASPEHFAGRCTILTAVEEKTGLRFEEPESRETMLSDTGGNALDSLVAAWVVYGMRETPGVLETEESDYIAEGCVYV